MINAFYKYNNLGIKCLPVQKDKCPSPGIDTWKGGITNEALYRKSYGIGLICGTISGNLECMDFDNHCGDAKKIISDFIAAPEVNKLYKKYNFPIESTMNGGYHVIYRCDETLTGNTKLARRPKWNEKTNRYEADAIIETRGEGGYFIADPTKGYKIVKNDITKIPVITKTERNLLFDIARTFNTWIDREKKDSHEDKDKPGDIYNNKSEAIIDARNCLLSAGWAEIRPKMWRRPGKKDGISATFGQIAEGIFYNFSSSAYPFEPNAGYKPFQIVALLKYNGDFSAFAKELAEKYKDVTRSSIPEKKKKKPDPLKEVELENLLNKAFIDIDIPVNKPPICMYIYNKMPGSSHFDTYRLFTLGNFSAITGKSKSKKTFLTSLMLAAASTNTVIQDKFKGNLPENKTGVLLFDTEQSGYDAWITSKRVRTISNSNIPNFGAFDLREYDPLTRCEIINYGIKKYSDNLGFVIIDGIADLVKAINDENEAVKIVTMLMQWSKNYNIHICNVIHQNKNDNYATGWLGSMVIKKAEAVLSVEKDIYNKDRSKVRCDNIRGTKEFDTFVFDIKNYLPEIDHNYNPQMDNQEI